MQGTPKAIEIKGINRNTTVIGAQDGQAEDLINLRFMDGSWRASGDGRLVHTMSGTQYTQLYVHTNAQYRHLLGVQVTDATNHVGTLYWFADIADDGVTFTPLATPVALTTVVGDIRITQNGHLLTIIDENDDFEYFVFKTGSDSYVNVNLDVNGKATERKLFPYGKIHFNLYEPFDEDPTTDTTKKGYAYLFNYGENSQQADYATKRNTIINAFNVVQEKNRFTRPFLVCAALKLYDGSFIYSSNPVLLWPREAALHNYLDISTGTVRTVDRTIQTYKVHGSYDSTYGTISRDFPYAKTYTEYPGHICSPGYLLTVQKTDQGSGIDVKVSANIFTRNSSTQAVAENYWFPVITECKTKSSGDTTGKDGVMVLGSDLVCSIDTDLLDLLNNNSEVFESVCIFVTPEVDTYNLSTTGFEGVTTGIPFFDMHREIADIQYDLTHNGFYLLKEYKRNSVAELIANPIVDLSGKEYENILKNIVQQKRFDYEATNRTTYLPKVSYMYNGRLHIANYKSYPFFGYPIDLFHLHNHSVKVQANSWLPGDQAGQRILPNLVYNNDSYMQYYRDWCSFPSTIPSGCTYYAFIEVEIETAQGTQKVVRYIEPFNTASAVNGQSSFIESLNPLITYPDARAKKMKIVLYSDTGFGNYIGEFNLKPHPYLNIAYYIDPDLKPIELSMRFSRPALPTMVNVEEYYPNGLKVSKTDNPMFFPVENAYQVGSAEILALMSNTIAVGTGQTGAAPLYVFCKDGVYALFVDASGQMTYSNSRVLARDVCNNPRSVTPIDAGVVFTTDRGLMMIAGEQVEEIGQPAEGDVLHFVDSTKVDYSKYASDALTKIAGLPRSLCDTTDFLTYLQGAIINYNHNMRELIVTNPSKSYSYVLDRERNWSRRDYTAAEYLNNYPTSYRVTSGGQFYKLDDEGDANTSLEQRKEAENQIFYLSDVIKLDSIGFKQAYRFVVRGYFETNIVPLLSIPFNMAAEQGGEVELGTIDIDPYHAGYQFLFESRDSRNLYLEIFAHFYYNNTPDEPAYDPGWHDISYSVQTNEPFVLSSSIYSIISANMQPPFTGVNAVKIRVTTADQIASSSEVILKIYKQAVSVPYVGIVVEGSYDGIKFAPLGYNRKTGKFTNIGCLVEHTDVRFFRVCLAGQVTGKTRIDYMELSADGSMLNTKIR